MKRCSGCGAIAAAPPSSRSAPFGRNGTPDSGTLPQRAPARHRRAHRRAAGSAISVITWIEILVGCRAHERTAVRSWLEGFRRLDLDQAVAAEAVFCRRQRGLKMPDAIILPTARCHGLVLATRNVRDFPPERGLMIRPYRLD
ncbi:MAG: PIN domain-containing protein [Synechococcaceae cyanobacterium]|nr:PIN domain-containing protein [Synechococcaceae cyanobacterium]